MDYLGELTENWYMFLHGSVCTAVLRVLRRLLFPRASSACSYQHETFQINENDSFLFEALTKTEPFAVQVPQEAKDESKRRNRAAAKFNQPVVCELLQPDDLLGTFSGCNDASPSLNTEV